MKKNKKFFSVLMSMLLITVIATLTACGGNTKDPDLLDSRVLNICMPDLGYGTDWMEALAEGFNQKTGIKVNVDITPTESGFVTSMRAGTARYDIYLMRENTYALVTSNAANYSGYDCILANLDDVYNSEVADEGIYFKDKLKDIYETYNRIDAENNGDYHYYAVQWCDSVFSMVRNLDVWDNSWTVPNTTEELIELCNTIKSSSKTPFIWSSQASYWWSVANLWVTQYQGLNDMYGEQGFWNGYGYVYDEATNSDILKQNVPEMWNREGIYYALTVLDELLNSDNGYQHVLSTSVDFSTAQGYFMTPSMNIAMMANGDWLYKEMSKNYPTAKISMMKTPVISDIINHSDCQGTISGDAELSALIAAIDNGSVSLTGEGYDVSQSAYNKVYEARNMYTCGSNINHVMVSPAYSDSLDIVKQFYNYLASDEGLEIYTRNSGGFTLGFNSSEEVVAASNSVSTDYVKSTEMIKQKSQVAPWPMYSSRLFSVGGMSIYPTIELGVTYPELILAYKIGNKSRMSAYEIWNQNYLNAANKWSSYMQTAGLS